MNGFAKGKRANRMLLWGMTDDEDVDMIITSLPYYSMRTYLPDQWIRLWFLGMQAIHITRKAAPAMREYDVWALKDGEKRKDSPHPRQGNVRQRR